MNTFESHLQSFRTLQEQGAKTQLRPVREVSNRGGNIIGKFPSLKMQQMLPFESLIERDYLYILDFEQDVRGFAAQPFSIPYSLGAKTRNYTPDFYVLRHTVQDVVECKPAKLVNIPENQAKHQAAAAWCTERNCRFSIVTDLELRKGFRLQNVKLLTQFARYSISEQLKYRIWKCLASITEPIKITDLMVQLAPENPESIMIPILHLAFHHEVLIPLDERRISPDSTVQLSRTPEKEVSHESPTI